MSDPLLKTKLPATRNPHTLRAHRRESFWQIILPLLLVVGLVAWLMVQLLQAGPASSEQAAQVAVILLAIPLLLLGIALFLALVVLSLGVARLGRWLPPQALRLQDVARSFNSQTQRAAGLAIRPLLAIESWAMALNRLLKRG
ncbi:MAG: hypothetical protein KIS85_08745 [Anaerolineales bacterium]|nr:hypothetical protein [Anaerolineales bacterium]